MAKVIFEIDGRCFGTLEGFFDHVGTVLGTTPWGRNFDAFNDVLGGGFGTPDEGFVLRWVASAQSRAALGYPATVTYLEAKLRRCHPSNVQRVAAELEAARRGEGPTLFDVLVEIVRRHGPGGIEAESGIELELA